MVAELHVYVRVRNADCGAGGPDRHECLRDPFLRHHDREHAVFHDPRVRQRRDAGDQRCDWHTRRRDHNHGDKPRRDHYLGTPALGTLKSTNYTFAFATVPGTGTLTITPVQLTVSAGGISRFYGLANPVLTYTISGYVNGETATTGGITGSPLLSTTAVANSPVGTYPITVQQGTLNATNYDFLFLVNSGTLTVNTARLIVRADNVTAVLWHAEPAVVGLGRWSGKTRPRPRSRPRIRS